MKKIPACQQRNASKIDAHVGNRIRARREQLNMSADALARAVRISRRKLEVYETGTGRLGAAHLSAIATVIGVPIWYFFDEIEQSPGETEPLSGSPKTGECERNE
jgi:transcriptional regulator with XRE-family HTH domain